jgi:hypothetical protein
MLIVECVELVFFGCKEKSECFTTFFCMPAMVDVVCIDHALQVFAFSFYPPPDALMNNDVVEYQIEYTVTSYANSYRNNVWIIRHQAAVTEKPYSGHAKY